MAAINNILQNSYFAQGKRYVICHMAHLLYYTSEEKAQNKRKKRTNLEKKEKNLRKKSGFGEGN